MTPSKLVWNLEASGVCLSVRKDVLHVSKSATQEQRELIKANKQALIAVLTQACPDCNQPLRTVLEDSVTWLQCPTDAAHYSERIGAVEAWSCPGDGCSEQIKIIDGQGWCHKHRMTIRLVRKLRETMATARGDTLCAVSDTVGQIPVDTSAALSAVQAGAVAAPVDKEIESREQEIG